MLSTLTPATSSCRGDRRIPEHIRGYGHVKDAHLHAARQREAELLARWREPLAVRLVA